MCALGKHHQKSEIQGLSRRASGAFTAGGRVQFLMGELRPPKLDGVAGKKKKKLLARSLMSFREQPQQTNSDLSLTV